MQDHATRREFFPDGTPIDAWFYDTQVPSLDKLGTPYVLTDYGIADDGRLYTAQIQALIDRAAQNGGGVIVVPAGCYRTGALFFKNGVHLYIDTGGVLMGSDDIADYPVVETRIEGETCPYFSALINADGLDGFCMCGPGTIDGNGLRSWKAFWCRRQWNPRCTNKDEQRPRLVYISHCTNVLIAGLTLQNAHFWTTHLYKSRYVKVIGCRIYSPAKPVPAPSTDAIDIDACCDVLIKDCDMAVNDDAVALKGGKGPWADQDPENGANERILMEDCRFRFCHSCLTCGSESTHNRNVLFRRARVADAEILLHLKMRPDTPQCYEYLQIEEMTGYVQRLFRVHPWTQFYDRKGRDDLSPSRAEHIVIQNIDITCNMFMDVVPAHESYCLQDVRLAHLHITADKSGWGDTVAGVMSVEDVCVNEQCL